MRPPSPPTINKPICEHQLDMRAARKETLIKILIVDDYPLVRRALKEILTQKSARMTLGEAEDARQMLELVRSQDWDMVLLDASLPDKNELDVLKELKRQHPELPVLVLGTHLDDHYGVRLLKAGAAGCLSMHNVPEELNAAIQKVLGGGKYTSASLAEKLALDLQPDIETPLHEKLSDREYQVLCLLASGLTIKQIGETLCLSAKTVSTYRTRIMKKMKLQNLTGLIRYALQNRLLAINSGP